MNHIEVIELSGDNVSSSIEELSDFEVEDTWFLQPVQTESIDLELISVVQ